MANSFSLITKYLQNAIDTVFATESKTNLLVLDEIISIDGKKFTKLSEFQEYISSLDFDDKANDALKGGTDSEIFKKHESNWDIVNKVMKGMKKK